MMVEGRSVKREGQVTTVVLFPEQVEFCKTAGISMSRLLRDAIDAVMGDDPQIVLLRKRAELADQMTKATGAGRQAVSRRAELAEGKVKAIAEYSEALADIVEAFRVANRGSVPHAYNLQWVRGRMERYASMEGKSPRAVLEEVESKTR